MEDSVRLYERTARALNAFFNDWTACYCEGCFKLCKDSYPDDEFANMELVEGVFPGCCQAGVAEDFRVMDRGEPLPAPLVSAIRKKRHDFLVKNTALGYDESSASDFVLRDTVTGQTKNGVGCKWLGESGCMLGQWKSPICLAFVCEPVRRWLSVSSGGDQWPLESDFCGVSRALTSIDTASTGYDKHYNDAFVQVQELENCLERRSKRLKDVSGLSQ